MKRKSENDHKTKRQKLDNVNINWKSATSFYNFINDDPILDYFQHNKINSVSDILSKKSNKYYKKKFPKSLSERGYSFEDNVFKKIQEECDKNNIKWISVCKDYKDIFKYSCYKTTKNKIKEGIDIIFHGILKNKLNKTYGQTDIIVKGSCLLYLFDVSSLEVLNDNYYIIDVKCSNLCIFNNTFNLTNVKIYNCYKTQLYIYNECLKNITKKENTLAFLLPNKFTKNGEIILNNDFKKLARVFTFNPDIISNFHEAIKWNNYLVKNNDEITLIPASKYTYPNMKNEYDYDGKEIKQYLSEKNGEITLLYRCNVEHRENAIKNNIFSIFDKRLTPEILGFSNQSSYYNIIKGMIECNNSDKKYIIPKENNVMEWRKNKKDVYIDFETFFDEDGYNWLYLVGVYYDKKYRPFIIEKKEQECERQNIIEFLQYLQEIKGENEINIWHWGNFEFSIICSKIGNYFIPIQIPLLSDMLEIFRNKDYPILFKGVFNFSIKSMYKYLKQEMYIDYDYQNVKNGYESMDIARNYYTVDNEKDRQDMKENILYYNKIDCKLMYDILRYIRHITL
jgi:hypothetical protein